MAYSKQTWDTTSYVNPTRMNHIEDGIYASSLSETVSNVAFTSIVDSTSNFVCRRMGDLVVLNISTLIFNTTPSNTDKIITGLPTPRNQISVSLNDYNDGSTKRVRVTDTWLQNLYSDLQTGHNYFGTIIYFAY